MTENTQESCNDSSCPYLIAESNGNKTSEPYKDAVEVNSEPIPGMVQDLFLNNKEGFIPQYTYENTKFHSNESCYELGELFYWPSSSEMVKSTFFFARKAEDKQEFRGLILLGCCDNLNRNYVVLDTSDKDVYLNFLNRCDNSKRTLKNSLQQNILHTHNINQFNIWIGFGKKEFIISEYPDCQIETEIFAVLSKFNSDEIPQVELKLELLDCPKFESNLQNIETYQEFSGFILLAYSNNRYWRGFVLHTCDYSIYRDWFHHFHYECGNDSLEIRVFRTFNKYQFDCWVQFSSRFKIFDPDLRFNEEIFPQKIKNIEAADMESECMEVEDMQAKRMEVEDMQAKRMEVEDMEAKRMEVEDMEAKRMEVEDMDDIEEIVSELPISELWSQSSEDLTDVGLERFNYSDLSTFLWTAHPIQLWILITTDSTFSQHEADYHHHK